MPCNAMTHKTSCKPYTIEFSVLQLIYIYSNIYDFKYISL